MSEEQPRRKRSRAARGKLRRGNQVESVVVEENFSLSLSGNTSESLRSELVQTGKQHANQVGEGCYVSATVHNNRYYGVLVEQSALKAASLLHFQDEANSLDLNRRMKMLQDVQHEANEQNDDIELPTSAEGKLGNEDIGRESTETPVAAAPEPVLSDSHTPLKQGKGTDVNPTAATETADVPNDERKRPAETNTGEPDLKRVKQEVLDTKVEETNETTVPDLRTIQKFRYVNGNSAVSDYRILLATYANVEAASEEDTEKERRIEEVCQGGGGFVGQYYFQYEVVSNVLETSKLHKPTDVGAMRTSLGFDRFLSDTGLPTWYPLRNYEMGQNRVLSMLKMKKGKGDKLVVDGDAAVLEIDDTGTLIPMQPRSRYRVGILGAGIAGLACATELLLQAERENIDLEVVVLEARDRIGGRLFTDETTFKGIDGDTPFPVDLGASWIHGIDHNPLASLAKEAGVNFVTSSEEVKMLRRNMGVVDSVVDDKIGDLFDDLLDQAADDCWEQEDFVPPEQRSQKAVRWYASVLGPDAANEGSSSALETDAPPHRSSSDVSIDHAIGHVIAKNNQKRFAKLSEIEQNLLNWNVLNINYALGANISDLSMKFWDVDDRHAFEGDHVLLREGYSQIVRHMMAGLKSKGERFQLELSCPIVNVEYARKSTTTPYPGSRSRKMVDLSDTCCVTAQDPNQNFKFDFLVSTLPLGVLKESVESDSTPEKADAVSFQPSLPFTKRDSIANVGFGLLNKVYLQFPHAFWRLSSVLPDGQILFGNASGVNPEHYMFYDMGKSLGTESNSPAILMTLISGKEAVASEQLSDEALVNQVLGTLRVLFSDEAVPEPVASKTTRWGSDKFSRGCYTFLPPGTSDQDFQILQSPINGNGDSLVLDESETMRLFFAGEHTTSLHPSMAHGAMLSGLRAAREVISTLQYRHLDGERGIDKLVPLAVFRKRNPGMTLQCNLCNLYGSRAKEGSLLAFQRGSRQVLAHNNCAENSPEVEVSDGKWKNVIKAVNRAKHIQCTLCDEMGATIGCTHPNCYKSYHFACGEETGWRFERDGKVFYCDAHRTTKVREVDPSECDQVSIRFFRSRFPLDALACQLCGTEGNHEQAGTLLIFQQRNKYILVHEKCARFSNLVETVEENEDEDDVYRNLLDAVSLSKQCSKCNNGGATIACTDPGCSNHFHYVCAEECGWNFKKDGKQFSCNQHSSNVRDNLVAAQDIATSDGVLEPSTTFATAMTTLDGSVATGSDASTVQPTFANDGFSPLTTNDEAEREWTNNGTHESLRTAFSANDSILSTSGTAAVNDTSVVNGKEKVNDAASTNGTSSQDIPPVAESSLFQHNLFCRGGSTVLNGDAKPNSSASQPSNAKVDGLSMPPPSMTTLERNSTKDVQESSDEGVYPSDDEADVDPMLQVLSVDAFPTLGRRVVNVVAERASLFDPWNVSFGIVKGQSDKLALCIEVKEGGPLGLENGDLVSSVNSLQVGTAGAMSVQEILSTLREVTKLEIGVLRLSKEVVAAEEAGTDIGATTQFAVSGQDGSQAASNSA